MLKKNGGAQREILQCMAWNAAARTVSDLMQEDIDYGMLGIQSLSQISAELD